MLDVTIVLLDDGFASTAVMPLEIFHSAGRLWNGLHDSPAAPAFRVRTVTPDGRSVRSAHGLATLPHGALGDVERTDVVLVSTPSLDLEMGLVADSVLLPWLRRQYEQGALVVGIHAGAAYLAEAGLLNGRIGTTHWALCDRFAARYPLVRWQPDKLITEDHRVLCAGGGFASIDVSLYLIEKLCGREIAVQCAKSLLLPMPRIPESGYAMQTVSLAHGDERVRRVEAFLQANYWRGNLSTASLADRAGLGERTFARHFKTATGKMPAAYLQALRIEAAKVMLERDVKAVQTISSEVGYDDVDFFRSLFKRMTQMTPTEYRAHFASLTVRAQATLPASALGLPGLPPVPSRSFKPRDASPIERSHARPIGEAGSRA